jgi:hypothetical protein
MPDRSKITVTSEIEVKYWINLREAALHEILHCVAFSSQLSTTDDNRRSRIFSAACVQIVVAGMRSCRPPNRTACASSDVQEASVFRGNGRSIRSLKSPH